MKKLISGTLMAFGLLLTTHPAHAAWYKGSPKEVFVSSGGVTTAILVTPAVSTNAVANASYMPGALYQVILSTGASTEYELLIDTTNCTGVTAALVPGNLPAQAYQTMGKLFYASTTANTVFTFDPPLRFDQGLCIIDSAVTSGGASITYELGRGISGQ